MTQWAHYPLYRNSRISIRIYKLMQLLTIQHNTCFNGIVLPFGKAICLSAQVLSIFVCIKFHDRLHPFFAATFASAALLCLCYELCSFPLYGNVYSKSAAFLVTGNYGRSFSKETRMVKRSLIPLGVSVGGRYFILPQTTLTFISFGVTMTANLLISTA